MLSPDEVRQKAERWWTNGALLRAYLTGSIDLFFPKDIPQIGLDKSSDKLIRFVAIQQEQEALQRQSKAVQGFGYSLEWTTQGSRQVGPNQYITRIYIESLGDFLGFIGKETEFGVFVSNIEQTKAVAPQLLDLLERFPRLVIEQADNWPDLLKVSAYFLQNPQPRQYVRALPIQVPTKFIETNRPTLRLLLDHLIADHLNPDETDFYRRFHLEQEEPTIKIRFLDESLRLHPALSHMSVWQSEFRNLNMPGSRVFVIENLTSFLTFPNRPDSLAIWGAGFAVTNLGGTNWLAHKQLYYWGDIDVHGFQMLTLFREHYPRAQSWLMDEATFRQHKTDQKGDAFNPLLLANLTPAEEQLYKHLLRTNARVEQERLGAEWVQEKLKFM